MRKDTIEVEVTWTWLCFSWTRKMRVPAPQPLDCGHWPMSEREREYHAGLSWGR